MGSREKEPLLLTPGPLTTSETVKEAMVRDWGSRDTDFIEMTARVQSRIERIAGVEDGSHVCVLLQGSGTFAVEAAITSLVPPGGKVLVLVNGAYLDERQRSTHVLNTGDPLAIWPPVAGG